MISVLTALLTGADPAVDDVVDAVLTLLVAVAAVTPTSKDDSVAERLKNLAGVLRAFRR